MVEPRITFRQRVLVFLRSSVVGLGAVVLDIGSLSFMVRVLGWDATVANVPSLVLGAIWIFVGNKYFAFEDHSKDVLKQGGKFAVIEVIALILNMLLFHLLVTMTALADYPEIARAIGTNITYIGFSYPLWTFFVFRYKAGQTKPLSNTAAMDHTKPLSPGTPGERGWGEGDRQQPLHSTVSTLASPDTASPPPPSTAQTPETIRPAE